MNIYGIPVSGRLSEKYTNIFSKLETNTPPEIWRGIRKVFVDDKEFELITGFKPAYYLHTESPFEKGASMGLSIKLEFSDGKTEVIDNFGYFQLPIIIVHSGTKLDEYFLAAAILHEVGHHNQIKAKLNQYFSYDEVFCHTFAKQFLSEEIFSRTLERSPFLFWPE